MELGRFNFEQLAEVAYMHSETTGEPLSTQLILNINDVKRLLNAFYLRACERKDGDNVFVFELCLEGEDEEVLFHSGCVKQGNRMLMEFLFSF